MRSRTLGIGVKRGELAQARELLWRLVYARFLKKLDDPEGAPDVVKNNPSIVGNFVHAVVKPSYCVYFMRCSERGGKYHYVKVGHAKNLRTRMAQIQSSCPLEVVHSMYALTHSKQKAIEIESKIHDATMGRINGEWFAYRSMDKLMGGLENGLEAAERAFDMPLHWLRYVPPGRTEPMENRDRRYVVDTWNEALLEVRVAGHDTDLLLAGA